MLIQNLTINYVDVIVKQEWIKYVMSFCYHAKVTGTCY